MLPLNNLIMFDNLFFLQHDLRKGVSNSEGLAA
jgi:hypothetical protein